MEEAWQKKQFLSCFTSPNAKNLMARYISQLAFKKNAEDSKVSQKVGTLAPA